MAMTSKAKVPETIENSAIAEYYRQSGTSFVEDGKVTIGYRYDQVEKRKLKKTNGQVFLTM